MPVIMEVSVVEGWGVFLSDRVINASWSTSEGAKE
jgi:hypothetical protein